MPMFASLYKPRTLKRVSLYLKFVPAFAVPLCNELKNRHFAVRSFALFFGQRIESGWLSSAGVVVVCALFYRSLFERFELISTDAGAAVWLEFSAGRTVGGDADLLQLPDAAGVWDFVG